MPGDHRDSPRRCRACVSWRCWCTGPGGLLLAAALGAVILGALFVSRGPLVRGLLAAVVGLSATFVGLATSAPHAVLTGLGGADLTGILATVAGISLVVLAFWIALHSRRLLVKLAVSTPACFVIAQWLIARAINPGIATHAPRPSIPNASTLGFPGARAVTFPARDGTRLSGWYVPGTQRRCRDPASRLARDAHRHARPTADARRGRLWDAGVRCPRTWTQFRSVPSDSNATSSARRTLSRTTDDISGTAYDGQTPTADNSKRTPPAP